ncbi:hypothetical protein COCMIDRAFT_21620 [Bipolaris oryzae ATCC 44560]|uniref:C3H1-type domain-containing protein n=1 Tax=Bipolaris oryzae ATCC 44560 TaxID=930090 RepID=W6ZTM5_COCMI|nr:uncharacterized protein COCMIDRAFT_21620 [Bipolaris oryzae ATCC 44560]EUC50904.1 hypothetical protein COCMIDRAFT_21620 [Bipolaris oryzae ATCC 44560]
MCHRSSGHQRHAPSRHESPPNRSSRSYESPQSYRQHKNSQYRDVPSGNYSPPSRQRYAQREHSQHRDTTHDQRDYYHSPRRRLCRSPTRHNRYIEYSQGARAHPSDYSSTESDSDEDYSPRHTSPARQDPRDHFPYEGDRHTSGRDRYGRESDHSPRRILPSRYGSLHTRTHEDSPFSREAGPPQHRAETLPPAQAVDDYLSRQIKNIILSMSEEVIAERAARIATETSEARPTSPQSQTPAVTTICEKGYGGAATTTHVALRSKTPTEICEQMQDEVKGLLPMEYDSNAEAPLMPYGFGSAWDNSASGCIFPWKYGATNSCSLGLCKDMFMGKPCRNNTCTHAHNWLSYDQLAYLLSQPDARTRKAAREFVHDFFPLWFHAWVSMDMPTFDNHVPPKPPKSLAKSWRLPLSN